MSAGQLYSQNGDIIDLPEISKLLIIGASDTSIRFSISIQNIGLFSKIHHVETIQHAIRLLKELRFSVIVLDHDDANIETISASRIINVNDPMTRILLISSYINLSTVLGLKNKGIIHAYLPVPEKDVNIHSIIVKEQSRYRIDQSLLKIIKDPPKFTTLYNQLSGSNASKYYTFKFLGMMVLESTVNRYSLFIEKNYRIDPLLTSSYLSAMSIYGKTLFVDNERYPLSYVEFDELTIFMKTIDSFQYLFFVEKRQETKVKQIEESINSILNRFQIKFSNYFSQSPDENDEIGFKGELEKIMRFNNEENLILDYNQKIVIANFDQPNYNLIELFSNTERVYEVHDFIDESHLFDFLKEEICHIVIFNGVEDNLSKHRHLFQVAKKISPYTQLIVTVAGLNRNLAFQLLNQDEIDKVISTHFTLDQYYDIIKQSVEKSRTIRELSNLRNLYQFYFSSAKTEVVKTLLLQDPKSMDNMSIPQFHGIIILQDDFNLFSEFWIQSGLLSSSKEDDLVNFLVSLMKFSSEYSNNNQSVSSLKFGHSNIILQKMFDFSFVYFIGNLDRSNVQYVQGYISKYTMDLFDHIINSVDMKHLMTHLDLHNELPSLKDTISQRCLNLVVELSIL